MKYFYWYCKRCDRRFRSIFSGGRGVVCSCGSAFGLSEITKREFDTWREEELKQCKAM